MNHLNYEPKKTRKNKFFKRLALGTLTLGSIALGTNLYNHNPPRKLEDSTISIFNPYNKESQTIQYNKWQSKSSSVLTNILADTEIYFTYGTIALGTILAGAYSISGVLERKPKH